MFFFVIFRQNSPNIVLLFHETRKMSPIAYWLKSLALNFSVLSRKSLALNLGSFSETFLLKNFEPIVESV